MARKGPAVERRERLYEGKAKIIYATSKPDLVIQYFKDDATAFNNKKRGTIGEKGIVNNCISSALFVELGKKKIPTHFVARLSDREMLVRKLKIIPVEMIVRNVVAGSLAKRLGLPEGHLCPRPIVECYYKSDPLDDPMINDDHIIAFDLAKQAQLSKMKKTALAINRVLIPVFRKASIRLVDFKIEFGMHQGKLLLGDEISPDTCRLWDAKTDEKLDKDRFRRDLGNVEESYREVARRVLGKDMPSSLRGRRK